MGCFFWTQKQQRAVIPSSWYSSYCAACFPASCSLYSFPKWLQTGSNYLRNIVSRMISVLFPVLGDQTSSLLSPAKHNICLRETSLLSAQRVMLLCHYYLSVSPFPILMSSRLPPAPFPQKPPQVPPQATFLLSPSRCSSRPASFPAGCAQPGGCSDLSSACRAVCAAGTCSPPRVSTDTASHKLLTLA